MYLHKFLYEVGQKLAPYVHTNLDFDVSDAICIGYSDTSKEDGYEKQNFEEGHIYIGFSTLADLQTSMSIRWFDVTKHIAYIEECNSVAVDLGNMPDVEVALSEAIWLIEELGANEHVAWPNGCNYEVLSAYCRQNNYNEAPLLQEYFGNNMLWRDLTIAQLKYIIKMYLICSPYSISSSASPQMTDGQDLDYLIKTMVNRFDDHPPLSGWDTQSYTGVSNPELDDFLQQVNLPR